MSRSRRKPWVKDGYGSKWKQAAKAYHNRKLRRKLKNPDYEIADGCAHKNGPGLNRWDVCDYRWYNEKPVSDKHIWDWVITLEEQMEEYQKLCRK